MSVVTHTVSPIKSVPIFFCFCITAIMPWKTKCRALNNACSDLEKEESLIPKLIFVYVWANVK